jgi:hypothetical protein
MAKIITSETDIELDPESLTDSIDISSIENSKIKRLEAIRDLDALLNNAESIANVNVNDSIVAAKEERLVNCVIKFESHLTKNIFVTNVNLNALNQTVIERNLTEIELTGDDKKLIQLFSFYQNNVFKHKRSRARIILQKKTVIRRRKRVVLRKNDVLVTKFYALIKNKKINLIDLSQYTWKVNEMKYAFDNNRSTIKMLLVRSK